MHRVLYLPREEKNVDRFWFQYHTTLTSMNAKKASKPNISSYSLEIMNSKKVTNFIEVFEQHTLNGTHFIVKSL